MTSGVLLDTHTLLWTVGGGRLRPQAQDAIAQAAVDRSLWVSVVTAWEIALLFHQERLDRFNPAGFQPRAWFENAIIVTRAQVELVDAEVAFDAWGLPEPVPKDPADRLLIATARARDLTLVTRDRPILAYSDLGHVLAIAC